MHASESTCIREAGRRGRAVTVWIRHTRNAGWSARVAAVLMASTVTMTYAGCDGSSQDPGPAASEQSATGSTSTSGVPAVTAVAAGPEWEPATRLAAPRSCCAVAVMDDEGTAFVAWVARDGGLRVRRQAADGSWGAVERVGAGVRGSTVVLGVDGAGKVTAVWDYALPRSGGYLLMSARRHQEGEWTRPTELFRTREAEASVFVLRLEENAAGEAVVVWEDDVGRIWAVSRTEDRPWSAATRLGLGAGPVAAIGESGVTTVAFTNTSYSDRDTIQDRLELRRYDGNRWSRIPSPPGPREARLPAIAAGPGDVAVLMWQTGQDPNPNQEWPAPPGRPSFTYSTARFDGQWSGYVRLADELGNPIDEQVVAGADGSAVFTWTDDRRGACDDIYSVFQPGEGQPGTPPQVVASDTAGSCAPPGAFAAPVSLAGNHAGDVAMVWLGGPKGTAVHVATREHGAEGWTGPEFVGPHPGWFDDSPAAAIDPSGEIVVAWSFHGDKTIEPTSGVWARRRTAAP